MASRSYAAMHGFNVIELVTVLSIFGILFALAMPEFRAYTQNTRMLAAAQGFFGASWFNSACCSCPEAVACKLQA